MIHLFLGMKYIPQLSCQHAKVAYAKNKQDRTLYLTSQLKK